MMSVLRSRSGLDVACYTAALPLSMYGNSRAIKCVSSGDQSVLLCCAGHLLQNLDIEHPVGYLVNSIVQSHHETYNCGTKTLLATINMLSRAAQKLKQEGLSDVTIARGLQQGIRLCVQNMETIKLQTIFKTFLDSQKPNSDLQRQRSTDVDPNLTNTNVPVHNSIVHPVCDQFEINSRRVNSLSEYERSHTHSKQQTDDDIGWFFDDGTVPRLPSIEEPVRALLDQVAHIFDDRANIPETNYDTLGYCTGNSFSLRGTENISDNHNQKHHGNYSSLTDRNDLDSDFEDCFDDDFKSDQLERATVVKRQDQSASAKLTLETSTISTTSNDEFDQCFDDIKYKEHDSECHVQKHVRPIQDEQLQSGCTPGKEYTVDEEKDSNELEGNFRTGHQENLEEIKSPFKNNRSIKPDKKTHWDGPSNLMTSEKNSKGLYDINMKLNHIMQKNSKLPKERLYNQSRHFKTMASSVAYHLSSCDQETAEYDTPCSASLESKHKTVQLTVGGRSQPCRGPVSTRPTIGNTCPSVTQRSNISHDLIFNSLSEPAIAKGFTTDIPAVKKVLTKDIPNDIKPVPCMIGNTRTTTSRPSLSDRQKRKEDKTNIKATLKRILESRPTLKLSSLQNVSRHMRSLPKEAKDASESNPDRLTVTTEMSFEGNKQGLTSSSQSISMETEISGTWSLSNVRSEAEEEEVYVSRGQVAMLVDSLSHGAIEAARLLTHTVWGQIERHTSRGEDGRVALSQLRFDPHIVNTLGLPGPPAAKSSVVDGLVVALSTEQLSLVGSDKSPRRALLINGDITGNFKHRGMNKTLDTTVILTGPMETSRVETWLQSVVTTVQKLSVRAIVAKGSVDQCVIDYCSSHNIVMVPNTPTRVLLAVAEASQADIATYVSECTKENVVENLVLEPWNCDWMDQVTSQPHSAYAVVKIRGNVLQTAVICHPCPGLVAVIEEQFWHCVHRVNHVTGAGEVLHGGGYTEDHLARFLHKKADEEEKNGTISEDNSWEVASFSVILRALAEGFDSLYGLVHKNNTGDLYPCHTDHCLGNLTHRDTPDGLNRHNQSGTKFTHDVTLNSDMQDAVKNDIFDLGDTCDIIYDDPTSKREAWQSAAHIVGQILLIDIDIVAGYTDKMNKPTGPDIIGTL